MSAWIRAGYSGCASFEIAESIAVLLLAVTSNQRCVALPAPGFSEAWLASQVGEEDPDGNEFFRH